MGDNHMTRWTDEMRQAVYKLWGEGWSSSQIARHINIGRKDPFTRNAVIGLVHRAGLGRPAPSKPKRVKASAKVGRIQVRSGMVLARPPAIRVVKPRLAEVSEDLPHRRPWLERGPRQCCWPIGEGADAWSCCAPTDEGDNYCTRHRARMFVTPSPSRQRSQENHAAYIAERAA